MTTATEQTENGALSPVWGGVAQDQSVILTDGDLLGIHGVEVEASVEESKSLRSRKHRTLRFLGASVVNIETMLITDVVAYHALGFGNVSSLVLGGIAGQAAHWAAIGFTE